MNFQHIPGLSKKQTERVPKRGEREREENPPPNNRKKSKKINRDIKIITPSSHSKAKVSYPKNHP